MQDVGEYIWVLGCRDGRGVGSGGDPKELGRWVAVVGSRLGVSGFFFFKYLNIIINILCYISNWILYKGKQGLP